MHVLFQCAQRWELLSVNPITLVRQGGQRQSEPEILTAEEFQALRKALSAEGLTRLKLTEEQLKEKEFNHSRARTMVILAVCLGLTRSEFTGLKWADFDWTKQVLAIQRGVLTSRFSKNSCVTPQWR